MIDNSLDYIQVPQPFFHLNSFHYANIQNTSNTYSFTAAALSAAVFRFFRLSYLDSWPWLLVWPPLMLCHDRSGLHRIELWFSVLPLSRLHHLVQFCTAIEIKNTQYVKILHTVSLKIWQLGLFTEEQTRINSIREFWFNHAGDTTCVTMLNPGVF